MKRLSFFAVSLLLVLTSCNKDTLEPAQPTMKYEVTFRPSLYGQVLPWLNDKLKSGKGFGDFEHKFLNHVIRIYTSSNVWVTDMPIVNASQSMNVELPEGSFFAEVLPVTEEVMTGEGHYTVFNEYLNYTFDRAAIHTANKVAFTVNGSPLAVDLPCITLMACIQLSINNVDYVTASLPKPELWYFNPENFTAHNSAGQEQATYAELTAQMANGGILGDGLLTGPTLWYEKSHFWFDNTSGIYYAYRLPGKPSADKYYGPNGLGANSPSTVSVITYLAFDLTGGTGSDFPTYWCHDYYDTRDFASNMTLRINYQFGSFSVTWEDFFGTIINN